MQTRAKIKRGSTDEETAERLDIAALYLKNLTSVVSMMNTNLGGKIDNLGIKLKMPSITSPFLSKLRIRATICKIRISSDVRNAPAANQRGAAFTPGRK